MNESFKDPHTVTLILILYQKYVRFRQVENNIVLVKFGFLMKPVNLPLTYHIKVFTSTSIFPRVTVYKHS